MVTRRSLIAAGGGALAALAAPRLVRAHSGETHVAGEELVDMRGTARGERVWFAPLGLAVAPGTRLRFVNRDAGNSHTATAYDPDLFERPRRIPAGAAAWDSGFLLPEESFAVTLDQVGVYDFYCIPHEMAGMVGRIVVGRPGDAGWQGPAAHAGDLPQAALSTFPPVDGILAAGRVNGEDSQ